MNHQARPRSAPTTSPLSTPLGWTDEALYQAITVCALFNFYNRWVDAAGVHPLDAATHRAHARRTAKAGYIRTPEP